ncbi:unnamed protein product, partial [Didymodactylos carnosus]
VNQVKLRHGSPHLLPQSHEEINIYDRNILKDNNDQLITDIYNNDYISPVSVISERMVPPLLINLKPQRNPNFLNSNTISVNEYQQLQRNPSLTQLNRRINDVQLSPLLSGVKEHAIPTNSIHLTPKQFVRKRIESLKSPVPSTVPQNNWDRNKILLQSERFPVRNERLRTSNSTSKVPDAVTHKRHPSTSRPRAQTQQLPAPTASNTALLNRIRRERNPHANPPLPFINGPSSTPKAKMFASVQAPASSAKEDYINDININGFDNNDVGDADEPIYVIARYDPLISNKPSREEIHRAVENQLSRNADLSPNKIVIEYNKPPQHPQMNNRSQQRNQFHPQQYQQIHSSFPQKPASLSIAIQSLPNNYRPQQNIRPVNNLLAIQHQPQYQYQRFQPIRAQRQAYSTTSYFMPPNTFKTIPGQMNNNTTKPSIFESKNMSSTDDAANINRITVRSLTPVRAMQSDRPFIPDRPHTVPQVPEMFSPAPAQDTPELSTESIFNMLKRFNISYTPSPVPAYPVPHLSSEVSQKYPEPIVIEQLPPGLSQQMMQQQTASIRQTNQLSSQTQPFKQRAISPQHRSPLTIPRSHSPFLPQQQVSQPQFSPNQRFQQTGVQKIAHKQPQMSSATNDISSIEYDHEMIRRVQQQNLPRIPQQQNLPRILQQQNLPRIPQQQNLPRIPQQQSPPRISQQQNLPRNPQQHAPRMPAPQQQQQNLRPQYSHVQPKTQPVQVQPVP